MSTHQIPTLQKVCLFWLPLASTWLMMSVEGPYTAALIARLPEAELNLAAFGVAFAVAMVFESPILFMLAAATALVKDGQSFLKLRRYALALSGAMTTILALILLDPFFNVVQRILDLPHAVAEHVRLAIFALIPMPYAVGYRRFYQGVLIRSHKPRLVAFGTVVRVSIMAISGWLLFYYSSLPGATIGCLALSFGMIAEASASRIMAWRTVNELIAEGTHHSSSNPLTYGQITRFYVPLALTSIMSIGVQPLLTYFVAHSAQPIKSLAILPVIQGLLFLFRSAALAYHEVVIALVGEKFEGHWVIVRFAVVLSVLSGVALWLFTHTPLAYFWFEEVAGLPANLAEFALEPAKVLPLIGLAGVWVKWQRGLLVRGGRTAAISQATLLQLVGLAGVLYVMIYMMGTEGALAATTALLCADLICLVFLTPEVVRTIRKRRSNQILLMHC